MIPVSPRTKEAERDYQQAKLKGKTQPLGKSISLNEWQHWRLIDNRFPYDMIYETHHMLIPKREVAHRWDLNEAEKAELEYIIRYYIYDLYDVWFENCPKRRSISIHYHLHLANYYPKREDMRL